MTDNDIERVLQRALELGEEGRWEEMARILSEALQSLRDRRARGEVIY